MSRIYILRHAKAEAGYPDSERPLADKGRKHARELAMFFESGKGFAPRAAWCSPLLRARQTLECFSSAIRLELPVRTVERLEPMADPAPLMDDLVASSEDLLIVGHNPNLEALVSLLLGRERSRVKVHLKTCALVCLETDPYENFGQTGPCTLQWMIDPRLL